ncbi:hypothetical protein QAD02_000311 [Eretmocerus hayati]|uniref:Uncharacterized protein n=1 Tax=Eretmocerus hayati TaxID=131215 RepID=A0ACC2ND98_9HYME|nr:hypothetical protein QAD02_000311 [Eretmocerus hayati]
MSNQLGDMDCDRMSSTIESKNIDLNVYRKLVKHYVDLHLYEAALFWADKVLSLSNENLKDVCVLAQCMYLMKQYHRATHLIKSRGLEKRNLMCYCIVIRCLLEAKEYTEAVQIINEFEASTNIDQTETSFDDSSIILDGAPKNVQSATLFIKGKVYEAIDNRAVAIDCYKQSLVCDVYAYQSFEALVQNQMLSSAEEKELLNSLPFHEQCKEADAALLKLLYESKLKKYQEPAEYSLSPCGPSMKNSLKDNLDMQVSKAERLYYNCNFHQSFSLTESILKSDPYHSGCLPLHIACLVELKKTNDLFYLAHKLVDLYPELALSWFAVGCYYYSIGKNDPARRYLAKATSLDRLFGPAWLANGHSFAAENEHVQAMTAYFKASQLMKGCHLPLLYIGLECCLTNNSKLADKFFQQAQSIAPDDPFVIHEIAVIAFQNNDYKTAEKNFKEALKKLQSSLRDTILPSKWEALLNNLGHTCRKMKKFDEALEFHQQALILNPLNPATYSAIAFNHAMMGHTQKSVDACHRALSLRRDDGFTTTLLGFVLEQLVNEIPPFPGAPSEIPKYESTKSKDETLATVSMNITDITKDSVAQDEQMDETRANLSMEPAGNSTRIENISTNEQSSEVEMLDSSGMKVE